MQSLAVRCLSGLHRAIPACSITGVLSPLMRSLHMMPVISREIIRKPLLQPVATSVLQSCGMKQKGKLTLRCDDCYYVMRKGRLFVMCKTKPRHKQMAMQKKEKNTWILTHATQSPYRAW
ncbi:39S ribosomal protein L36, mitochondrial-like [Penaeus japonicus]|uniref:39S ribosomal protein L36, mitochondrial-like n=1 Tax=Penaeus japonicus TaxID=27405 RepID=UPI001C70BAE5|nr:39S ribosomal protein L36, mitochondrial-like [Penaeus japonicus]